nr:939_t:CDS:10 [Entrophospora candida]
MIYIVERISQRSKELNNQRVFISTIFQSRQLIIENGLNLGDIDQLVTTSTNTVQLSTLTETDGTSPLSTTIVPTTKPIETNYPPSSSPSLDTPPTPPATEPGSSPSSPQTSSLDIPPTPSTTEPGSSPSSTPTPDSSPSSSLAPTSPSPTTSPTSTSPNFQTYIKYDEKIEGLRVFSTTNFPNGTIIMRLVKPLSVENVQCFEPMIYLRIIYNQNNIIEVPPIENIPGFNFCLYGKKLGEKPNDFLFDQQHQFDLIRVYPLTNKFLFIVWLNDKNAASNDYEEVGSIYDLNGKLFNKYSLSRIKFSDIDTSSVGHCIINANPDLGFLWVNRIADDVLQLTKYSSPDLDGNLFKLENQFNLSVTANHFLKIFHTSDNGYGIVSAGPATLDAVTKFNNTQPSSELVYPQYIITTRFIRAESSIPTETSVIYSTVAPIYSLSIELCVDELIKPGIYCIVKIITDKSDTALTYYLKIFFLSNGSTKNVTELSYNTQEYDIEYIFRLYYGGNLICAYHKDSDNIGGGTNDDTYYYMFVYNDDGIFNQTIDLPIKLKNSERISFGLFPNDTAWIFTDNKNDNNWSLLTFNTVNITSQGNDHNSMNNLMINTTIPLVDSTISVGSTNLSISYYNPIILSNGNISIYQTNLENRYNISEDILRQTFSAKSQYCTLSNDDKTISFKVLDSSFGFPNTGYYVVIDNGFVKDIAYEESLLGIQENIWKFRTKKESALVRLTLNGSSYYSNLLKSEQYDFLYNLRGEMAKSIPVEPEIIGIVDRYQWDPDIPKQLLLKFDVFADDNNNKSVIGIIKILDTLIRNMDITSISQFKYTGSLDASSVWDKYGLKLLAIGGTLLFLGILALFAYRKHEDGNSFVTFKVLLINLDFVIDLAFVSTHSRDIFLLFYFSLFTFIIPLVFNMLMVFYIIIKELSNNQPFYGWYRKYHNVAAIFTFLAAIDVESLSMIDSKLGELDAFDAPISNGMESWIKWINAINFFIEDTPHLIIQMVYINLSVNYEIIPFLNLLSSSLIVACIILNHLFRWLSEFLTSDEYSTSTSSFNGSGSGSGAGLINHSRPMSEVMTVEYVLTPPEDIIMPATIRTPALWAIGDNSSSTHDAFNNFVATNNNMNRSNYQRIKRTYDPNNIAIGEDNGVGVGNSGYTVINSPLSQHGDGRRNSQHSSSYCLGVGQVSRKFKSLKVHPSNGGGSAGNTHEYPQTVPDCRAPNELRKLQM